MGLPKFLPRGAVNMEVFSGSTNGSWGLCACLGQVHRDGSSTPLGLKHWSKRND